MANKQLIIETTKVREGEYIVSHLFRGKCLKTFYHKGNLNSIRSSAELDYGLVK